MLRPYDNAKRDMRQGLTLHLYLWYKIYQW
jgi:hypothetical protein